jgi:serine/threonine protein kinase
VTGDETVVAAAGPTPAEPPQKIDGRYVLEAMIGGGGMGKVYRALDTLLVEQDDPDPYVALKLLSDTLPNRPLAAKALQRECKRAQKLMHENIVRVAYFGRDGDKYYLTMELLKGRSFAQLLEERKSGLPPAEAFDLARPLLSALAYAHRHDIVHSDIKPSNLFLTDEGMVKVLDFGIAAPLMPEGGADTGTFNPRSSLGALSLKHAALEMWLGVPADPSDDVYSAACVIYELLSGNHPYGGEPAPNAYQRNLVPADIPSLAPHQNEALKHALRFTRQQRTATIDELRSQLFDPPQVAEAVPEPIQEPAPTTPPAATTSRMRPAMAIAAAVLLAAIAVGIWLALANKVQTDNSTPSQPELAATPADTAATRADAAPTRANTAAIPVAATGPAPVDFPESLFSAARACPDLERDWSNKSCPERQQCFATRASDAHTSLSIASDDLKPIYRAREEMSEYLSQVDCALLDASRSARYRKFIAQFPGVPIS